MENLFIALATTASIFFMLGAGACVIITASLVKLEKRLEDLCKIQASLAEQRRAGTPGA
jgi:hypothetical protein